MLGIFIILSLISLANFSSFSSFTTSSSLIALTSALIASASSFWPSFIRLPILSLRDFLLERSSSPCILQALLSLSRAITSSTKWSFWSWNLFLMFCLTTSGFSLKNLMSIITYTPFRPLGTPFLGRNLFLLFKL